MPGVAPGVRPRHKALFATLPWQSGPLQPGRVALIPGHPPPDRCASLGSRVPSSASYPSHGK